MTKERLFWYRSKSKPKLPITLTYINEAGGYYGFEKALTDKEIQANDLRCVFEGSFEALCERHF